MTMVQELICTIDLLQKYLWQEEGKGKRSKGKGIFLPFSLFPFPFPLLLQEV